MNPRTYVTDTRLQFRIVARCALILAWLARGAIDTRGLAQELAEVNDASENQDAAVSAIVESNPDNPMEIVRAADVLIDLGQPDMARGYLRQLVDANLSPSNLVNIHQTFGSAVFLRFGQLDDLRPEGLEIARAVFSAASQWARNPDRIAALVSQMIENPSAAERRAAMVKLSGMPELAVNPIIEYLSGDAEPAHRRRANSALKALGPGVAPPLMAIVRESGDDVLVREAARVVAASASSDLIPYMIRPSFVDESSSELKAIARQVLRSNLLRHPTQAQAVGLLNNEIDRLLAGERRLGPSNDVGETVLWHWDSESRAVEMVSYLPMDAGAIVAARIAAELARLAPSRQHENLRLFCQLQAAKLRAGLSNELRESSPAIWDEATRAERDVIQGVLEIAIERGQVAGAIAACEVVQAIAESGRRAMTPKLSQLLRQGVRNPNRRVRVAAGNAIVACQSPGSFAGASELMNLVRYLIRAEGTRRALLGMHIGKESRTLAGMLRESGFVVDVVASGREVTKRAIGNPDYEFVLLSDSLPSPRSTELIQHLRQHPNSAQLPIAVIASDGARGKYIRFAERDRRLVIFPIPKSRDTLGLLVRQLIRVAGRELIPAEARLRQAEQALAWVTTLIQSPDSHRVYEFMTLEPALLAALHTPQLTPATSKILANLGTPKAQSALVELASQPSRSVDHRRAAASALDEAVRKNRLQLTTEQIKRQYARYNASEFQDKATQRILGSILDSIETNAKTRDGFAP